jgi:hypothetical protein
MIPGLLDQDVAREAIVRIMEGFDTHPIRTPEGFRSAAIDHFIAVNPVLDIKEETAVNFLIEVIQRTILEGRMIDFGFIPNQMLQETSLRTREIYEAGELQHPYDSWLGLSAWEGGYCGYLIANAVDDGEALPEGDSRLLCVELYGVAVPGMPSCVMINDIVSIDVIDSKTYFQPVKMIEESGMNEKSHKEGRCANLLDPMVTFLRILSDASVPVVDVPAPERLNKARTKRGKSLIPAYTRVETRDYVSAYRSAVKAIHEGKGGHHASPIPHWRRAHQRHLHDGKVVPVRSSKVNWRDHGELHRLFYRAKP